MEINEAVEVLRQANLWRRDDEGIHDMPNPRELGIAIDVVVNEHSTKTNDTIREITHRTPLARRLKVVNELAFIDLITELGYRENKRWTDDEESTLNMLCELAQKHANTIMQEIQETKHLGTHNDKEPPPKTGGEDVTSKVVKDLEQRSEIGERKYGTKLQTHNGRKPLVDAYQEILDLAVYVKQELMER